MRARAKVSLFAIATLLCALAPTSASAAGPGDPGDPCDSCPPSNTAPTIAISANDDEPFRGQVVTFTAVADDADGDTLTITWDLDDGSAFDDATGTTAMKSFSSVRQETIRAQVDDGTTTRTDTMTIDVVNRAPVANFTISPASPKTGETVTFTSTASDADNDTINSRVWDLDNDGTFGEVGETGNAVSRSFTPAGAYTVKHKVTDSFSAESAAASKTVTVANRAPVASFTASPTSPLSGEQVLFDSALSSDPDGTFTRAWDLDDDNEFDDGTGTQALKTFALPGTYTVTLRVTDNLSATTDLEHVVTVGNRLPTASFTTSPGTGVAGEGLWFDATAATDPEMQPMAKYEWDFDGNGTYDADTQATQVALHTYPAPGTYSARLRVTDAHGGKAETTRSVVVVAPPVVTGTNGTAGTNATGTDSANSTNTGPGGGPAAPSITGPSSLKLRADKKSRFALKGVGVTCPTGCVVKLIAKSGKTVLAKLAFTGSRGAVRLTLSKKGRALLKRKRKLTVSVLIAVTPASGAPVSKTLKVVLRRR